jgi:Ca2+-binding RTX toxin-like protein
MAALTVAQILSGGSLGLTSGLEDLLFSEIGGRRVLYLLNRAENRLIELSVASDGDLSVAGSLGLSGTVAAGSSGRLTSGSLASGSQSLAISGLDPSDSQQITLSATGALVTQQALSGVGQLEHAAWMLPGGIPVLVSGGGSGGLSLYADGGPGFAFVTALADDEDRFLADVSASASFTDAGTHYLATASSSEHGVNIVSVTASGLVQTGALGAANGLPISAPTDLATIARLDMTMLVVASFGTSSLSVLMVEDGVPALADHVYDSPTTAFQGAGAVSAVTHGDFAFVAAGGAEGGVSLLTVLPGGRLIHLDSVHEDETAPLDQINAIDTFIADGMLHIVTGSANEAGVARLSYDLSNAGSVSIAASDGTGVTGTALDDHLIGSVVGETLSGLSGDDILLDARGNDVLIGGPGSDLFVFTADGQTDQIADFERGVDRLDLSAFDFLYDVSQLGIAPTASGATLSFGNETIFVTTADGLPLTSADLTTADILNVDRPPFLLIGREIIGTSADELLIGGPGDDTIVGAGGADSLAGGPGLDLLLGSPGDDTLDGGSGRDTLIGGSGDDLLWGGDGGDILYGDDWP